MPKTLVRENIRLSLQTVLTNRLRSILTIFIIAFGIMALVGIFTAIESLKKSITDEFSVMGANTFTIESRGMNIRVGGKRYRSKNYSFISYKQAERFKEDYNFPSEVSIWVNATSMGTVKHGTEKTNPNIPVIGIDENYVSTSGLEILRGRNFSAEEIMGNRNFVLIGSELADKLFKNYEDPLDKIITVGSGKFKVIGVMKEKGSGFGMSNDKACFLPYTVVRQYFSRPKMAYSISIKSYSSAFMDAAIGQAEGVFRNVRNLNARDATDFNITKSDNLINIFLELIEKVNFAAIIIAGITLMGAVVGLMNIMLVSVTERTREIGIRKALGARKSMIKQQFLFEAIVIGQLGGILGIVLGILMGNSISYFLKSPFAIPWFWIFVGVVLCLIVGVVSGYFPAVKAANQDPIEALRYE